MINNSNLINEIIKKIKTFTKNDLSSAMQKVDETLNPTIQIPISYLTYSDDYKIASEFNTFNDVHIKKKTFLDIFKKSTQEDINRNSEAA